MTLQTQLVLYLRLINFEGAKQICQPRIAVLNVLSEAWFTAHFTTCITQSARL